MSPLSKSVTFILMVTLITACQTTSIPSPSSQQTQKHEQRKPVEPSTTPDGVKITPYDRPEIKREQIIIPEQKNRQNFDDGRDLPAFKQLLKNTQNAFQQGQWNEAEKYALNAQRLAPQSAETYMYLAMIANHKKKPANAESLAQRGLSYAQTTTMQRQLWSIILKSAQAQNNSSRIQQAQTKLSQLK